MRTLCDTSMIHCIRCLQTGTYNLPGCVCGHNHKGKLKFADFTCSAVYALTLHQNTQTFEIESRAASVLYQNNELHII